MTNPAIDCETVVRELWDFLDGELDEARWQRIRDHLAQCTGCASHVEFAQSFLAQVAKVPTDPDEVARLRTTVQQILQSARAT